MIPGVVRFATIAALALLVASCGGETESYRFKLTLAVDTPTGVKRASSVVEVTYFAVRIPDRGVMHRLRGEAVYLELEPSGKPIVALLTRKPNKARPNRDIGWTPDAGPGFALLFKLYGLPRSESILDDVRQIAPVRGPRSLPAEYLPTLVTFGDVNDPGTVIEVDPKDLQATLGPNIVWREITLESTDEPLTTGIGSKLSWLQQYRGMMLDGDKLNRFGAAATFANSLSTADFRFPGDPRK